MNQYHAAPEPRLPPVRPRVDDAPWQIDDGVAFADEADIDPLLTTIVTLAQRVVLHRPSALTKYFILVVGLCIIELPEPIKVPPQLPEYQIQLEFVPSDPPFTARVEEEPGVIIDGVAVAEFPATERLFTATGNEIQEDVLQSPSALTQYVEVIFGIITGEVPEPAYVPPHEPVYQTHDAPVPRLPPVTLSVAEFPEHIWLCPLTPVGFTETVFMATVTETHVVVLTVPCALI